MSVGRVLYLQYSDKIMVSLTLSLCHLMCFSVSIDFTVLDIKLEY